jgi:adenosyl cobinamide kinase/adenosyl cobinamide phosphate guanylyltransferase
MKNRKYLVYPFVILAVNVCIFNISVDNISSSTDRPVIINESNGELYTNVLWSGLGGALGGAIAGGLLSSFLQSYFSNRSVREKDHLSDFKQDIVEPLLNTVSKPTFGLLDFNFVGFRYGDGEKPQSDDALLQDFMENHHSKIHEHLGDVIKLGLDYNNQQYALLERLRSNIHDIFTHIEHEEKEYVLFDSIHNLARNILQKNDLNNDIRIAKYTQNRYLYYYPTENPLIFFSNEKDYGIFKSVHEDEELNIRRTNEVKSYLVQNIGRTMDELRTSIDNYKDISNKFSQERTRLVEELLQVKYSTKLKFERKGLEKKCRLT